MLHFCLVSVWYRLDGIVFLLYHVVSIPPQQKNGWDIAFSVNWFDSANAWFRTQKCSRLTLVRSCHVYSLRFAVYIWKYIYHYISSYIFVESNGQYKASRPHSIFANNADPPTQAAENTGQLASSQTLCRWLHNCSRDSIALKVRP